MRTIIPVLGFVLAIAVFALVGCSVAGLGMAAFAQEASAPAVPVVVVNTPGVVALPWGDWVGPALANLRDLIISGFVTLAGFLLARFAPSLKAVFDTMRVEQLLTRAVDFGIASVAGATKGKSATIPIANEVLEKALEYAVDAAPSLVSKISDTIRPKLIARIGSAGIVPIDAAVGPVVDAAAPTVLGLMGVPKDSMVTGFVEAYPTPGI